MITVTPYYSLAVEVLRFTLSFLSELRSDEDLTFLEDTPLNFAAGVLLRQVHHPVPKDCYSLEWMILATSMKIVQALNQPATDLQLSFLL